MTCVGNVNRSLKIHSFQVANLENALIIQFWEQRLVRGHSFGSNRDEYLITNRRLTTEPRRSFSNIKVQRRFPGSFSTDTVGYSKVRNTWQNISFPYHFLSLLSSGHCWMDWDRMYANICFLQKWRKGWFVFVHSSKIDYHPVHIIQLFFYANHFAVFGTNHRFNKLRVCRRQFYIGWKRQKVLHTGRKHCGKRRNCSLRAISPFPTVFSKDLYCRHVKTRACLGKG